jgi:hypothetical protein
MLTICELSTDAHTGGFTRKVHRRWRFCVANICELSAVNKHREENMMAVLWCWQCVSFPIAFISAP